MQTPSLINHDGVDFYLEIANLSVQWGVHTVSLDEGINLLGELHVEARVEGPALSVAELLGRDALLRISSEAASTRVVRGIVRDVEFLEDLVSTHARFSIVPAAWLLTQRVGSRIFQDKTVPEIVQTVFAEHLGSRRRGVRIDGLARTYPTYEYIVQYQESEWDFIARLLASEGIVAYFDHDSDDAGEQLVLCDSNSSLPNVTSAGSVPYWHDTVQAPTGEAITHFSHHERLGTSGVALAEHDWTHPERPVVATRAAAEGTPPLEVFDHSHAVRFHRYDAGSGEYGMDTSEDGARLRQELLVLHRNGWHMEGKVVSAQPGHIIDLSGHPDGTPNGRYAILAVRAHGRAEPDRPGGYHTSLVVVPVAHPVRPPRRVTKPIVPGPELATVVTNNGLEVETDRHGRILVHFHWDRRTQERPQTCWLRVAQGWAGTGFGFQVLPRAGMEVLVSFLGGDPDRPVVTGCLYNGTHTNHYRPDQHPTRTVFRTDSSPNASGFNELSFEDAAGNEEVFLHSQKNLREEVLNDHTTRVDHDQANTVDNDQTEEIGNNQTIHVQSTRSATVGTDHLSVRGARTHRVGGTEHVTTHGHRTEVFESGCDSSVPENQTHRMSAGTGGQIVVAQGGVGGDYGYLMMTDPDVRLQSTKRVIVGCGDDATISLEKASGEVYAHAAQHLRLECGDSTYIDITDGEIQIVVGESSIRLTPTEILAIAPSLIRESAALIELNP